MTEEQMRRAAEISSDMEALRGLRFAMQPCNTGLNYFDVAIRSGNIAVRIRDVFIPAELARLKAEVESL